jgi:hypothetical protein
MSIKLEVGNTYTTRGGEEVKIIRIDPEGWGSDAGGMCWDTDGCRYDKHHTHHTSIDLDDPVNGGAPEFPIFML